MLATKQQEEILFKIDDLVKFKTQVWDEPKVDCIVELMVSGEIGKGIYKVVSFENHPPNTGVGHAQTLCLVHPDTGKPLESFGNRWSGWWFEKYRNTRGKPRVSLF